MNIKSNRLANTLKLLALGSILLFSSANSLAELTQVETVYTQKSYPYGGLVQRSDQVRIFYSQSDDNINCRVEVSNNGNIWRGSEHNTSEKEFSLAPLSACMDRVDAKRLLADTF